MCSILPAKKRQNHSWVNPNNTFVKVLILINLFFLFLQVIPVDLCSASGAAAATGTLQASRHLEKVAHLREFMEPGQMSSSLNHGSLKKLEFLYIKVIEKTTQVS